MDKPDQWRAFAFYSTSLRHLMPAVPLDRHAAYFEKTRQLKELNNLENSHRQLERLLGAGRANEPVRPAIVATFHTGPYHLVCGWLMRRRIPFSLVLSDDIARNKAAAYSALYAEATHGTGPADEFGLINAADPHCLLQMRSALRRGHLLVLYVDGNEGVGGQTQLRLDFMQGKLRVKTGAAYLSYLMRCPVYPVLCHWEGDNAQWKSAQPIQPGADEPARAYIRRCMAGVYGLLSDTLAEYAPQWEGWGYVHHDIEAMGEEEDPAAGAVGYEGFMQRFMPFAFDNATFLLQRSRLLAYPLPTTIYDRVWKQAREFFRN